MEVGGAGDIFDQKGIWESRSLATSHLVVLLY